MNGSPDRADECVVAGPREANPEPTEDDLQRVAGCVGDALDAGRLDVEEAGQRLAAIYRARSRRTLDALVQELAPGRREPTTEDDRSFYIWAAVRVTLFAIAATILLYAALDALTIR